MLCNQFEMQNVRPFNSYAKSQILHNLYFRAHIYMCIVLFFPQKTEILDKTVFKNGCIILHSC